MVSPRYKKTLYLKRIISFSKMLLSKLFLSFILFILLIHKSSAYGQCYDNSWNCLKCKDSANCETCMYPNYFVYDDHCEPCNSKCLECTETYTNCIKCHPGFYLTPIPNSNYKTCEKCKEDSCLECVEENGQYQCTNCLTGYFINSTNMCQKCDETCQECKGPGKSQCTKCKDGYYNPSQDNGNEEFSCSACATHCKTCTSSDINDCTECLDGYYYAKSLCRACDPECKTCESQRNLCTSCYDGKYLDGAKCSDCPQNCKECNNTGQICLKCNEGYALDGDSCTSCMEYNGCATCEDTVPIKCKTCLPNKYPYEINDNIYCYDCNVIGCSVCSQKLEHFGYHCDKCLSTYFRKDSQNCVKCEYPCYTCSDSTTTCSSCVDGFYLEGTKCLPCGANCLQCNSAEDCTLCNSTYYSLNGVCVGCNESCHICHDSTNNCDVCKDGYYFNAFHRCVKCTIEHCDKCNSTHCLDCAPEYYPLDDGSCSPCAPECYECYGPTADDCYQCDPGYYLDNRYRVCIKCHESCDYCTGPTDLQCINCSSGYFLSIGEINTQCVKCERNCIKCTNVTNCLECEDGYYRNTEPHELPDGIMSSADCERCKDRGCKKCLLGVEKCTECFDGFYELVKTEDNLVSCGQCPSNCKTCHADDKHNPVCTDCFDGYYIKDGKCNKCVSPCEKCTSEKVCTSCVKGHLFDGVSSCDATCSPDCETCEGSESTCKSCPLGYVLRGTKCVQCLEGCRTCEARYWYDDSTLKCTSCIDGYFLNEEDGICSKCNHPCLTCMKGSYGYCYTCVDGYYLSLEFLTEGEYHTGECAVCSRSVSNCELCISDCDDDLAGYTCSAICTKCSEQFYLSDDGKSCLDCHNTCKTCDGPSDEECIECKDGLYKYEGKCVACNSSCLVCAENPDLCAACQPHHYLKDGICYPCDSSCDECENEATNCTKCKKFIYENKCYNSCLDVGEGFGGNLETWECYKCQLDNCLEYDDGCQCQLCKEGYFIESDPLTHIEFCVPCALDNCKACNGIGVNDCTECNDGYYLHTFSTGAKECKVCEGGCTICSTATICSSCKEGYFLNTKSECENCHPPCTNCSGSDGSICSKCEDKYYHTTDDKCLSCNSPCDTCFGPSATECNTCADGYHLFGSSCLECTPPCLTCTAQSLTECLSCVDKHYLVGNKCKECKAPCENCQGSETQCTSCLEGYYITGQTCTPCPTGCATCTSSGSTTQCQKCIDGYIKTGSSCEKCGEGCATCVDSKTNCPKCIIEGYYHDDKNNACHTCDPSCFNCTGPANTDCIECNDGYMKNGTACDLIPNGCVGNRCDLENDDLTKIENYTLDTTVRPSFVGSTNPGSGGAVRLINFGLVATDVTFTSCTSQNGGGGGIFIYNKVGSSQASYSITLIKLTFKKCTAKYGAAVYIFSPSEISPIQILLCTFDSNEATSTSENSLFGGSALYITAKLGAISECVFLNNKGKGGAVKISEDFSVLPEGLRMLQKEANYSQGSIVISGCSFQINEYSDCSLFYANEKRSTKIEINDCTFTGKLTKDAHYIDGNPLEEERPNVIVRSCKFSADKYRALNSKFIKVDLNNQVLLNNNNFEKKHLTSKSIITFSTLALAATIIITIVVLKRNHHNAHSEDERQDSTEV